MDSHDHKELSTTDVSVPRQMPAFMLAFLAVRSRASLRNMACLNNGVYNRKMKGAKRVDPWLQVHTMKTVWCGDSLTSGTGGSNPGEISQRS
jgi:hypothetical protein